MQSVIVAAKTPGAQEMGGCESRALRGACSMLGLLLGGCGATELEFHAAKTPVSIDGAIPSGPMIEAADGYLYGTTAVGGQYNQGTVFKLAFDGQETLLYSFLGGNSDGANPGGGLLFASDGNLYGTTRSGGVGSCGGSELEAFVSPPSTCGTVFEITLAGTEHVLYFFNGSADGGQPMAGVIQGQDGNLYGTTATRGTDLAGTLFQLTLAGSEAVIYTFGASGPTDGAAPLSAVTLGNDGNFYGTTLSGGSANAGTVYAITPAGSEVLLNSFHGGSDGDSPEQALIQASDGDFYGTTADGGRFATGCRAGCGTVFKLNPAGQRTLVYEFGLGLTDGIGPSSGLIQASDGSFYGTTSAGGDGNCSFGCGTVYKVTLGGVETVLYSFRGGSDGAAPQATLLQGSDGALYGTTSGGGAFNQGTAFRVTLDGMESVLHSFGGPSKP